MSFLNLRAYLTLILFDMYLARGDFAALYGKVRNYPLGAATPGVNAVDRISAAVNMACIWYWKEILCLQRSAATACLLKKHGIPAQMVIGAQLIPFTRHTPGSKSMVASSTTNPIRRKSTPFLIAAEHCAKESQP
jgi:hypothetical protein